MQWGEIENQRVELQMRHEEGNDAAEALNQLENEREELEKKVRQQENGVASRESVTRRAKEVRPDRQRGCGSAHGHGGGAQGCREDKFVVDPQRVPLG